MSLGKEKSITYTHVRVTYDSVKSPRSAVGGLKDDLGIFYFLRSRDQRETRTTHLRRQGNGGGRTGDKDASHHESISLFCRRSNSRGGTTTARPLHHWPWLCMDVTDCTWQGPLIEWIKRNAGLVETVLVEWCFLPSGRKMTHQGSEIRGQKSTTGHKSVVVEKEQKSDFHLVLTTYPAWNSTIKPGCLASMRRHLQTPMPKTPRLLNCTLRVKKSSGI